MKVVCLAVSLLLLWVSAEAQQRIPLPSAALQALKAKEPALRSAEVVQQRQVSGRSSLLVRATSKNTQTPWYALMLLQGKRATVLDVINEPAELRIVRDTDDGVVVGFIGNYNIEGDRIYYALDAGRSRVTERVSHKPVRITRLLPQGNTVRFEGKAGEQTLSGIYTWTGDQGKSSVEIMPGDLPEGTEGEQRMIGGRGNTPIQTATTSDGTRHRFRIVTVDKDGKDVPPGITVVSPRPGFYSLDRSTLAAVQTARPGRQATSIGEQIGPHQTAAGVLWFAKEFYDGEGITGIGALGSFDFADRRYTMLSVPEMANWSGSALHVEEDAVYVGLVRHPEGADIPGGVLRYDLRTQQSRVLPVDAVVLTMQRMGQRLLFGTTDGMYAYENESIVQYEFVPRTNGSYQVVRRAKP